MCMGIIAKLVVAVVPRVSGNPKATLLQELPLALFGEGSVKRTQFGTSFQRSWIDQNRRFISSALGTSP